MKVMTYNIQHCKNFYTGKIEPISIAEVIRRQGAEIICLNEVYGKGIHPNFTDQAKAIGEELGYEYYFSQAIKFTGLGPYGNAVISKYPFVSVETIPVPTVPRNHPGYFEDRAAFSAIIDVEGRYLHAVGCHFGLQPEEQEMCVKTVCDVVDHSDYPVILMGDFNVHPDDPVLAPIRKRLLDSAALPGGDAFTYPSDKPDEKIDYIFYSEGLRLQEVSVPKIVVSDHLPVVGKFSF